MSANSQPACQRVTYADPLQLCGGVDRGVSHLRGNASKHTLEI
ncbi:MAG: hypothetical protein QY306_17310 [Anaerolineales bacterium]|nr:MAG: hypothetical protein QY306_17310 [Anaerolineales bacterium]